MDLGNLGAIQSTTSAPTFVSHMCVMSARTPPSAIKALHSLFSFTEAELKKLQDI